MNAEYEYQIGQRLKVFRERMKMTQDQVSAQFQVCGCDLTRSAVAKIEVGQRHIYPDEIYIFAKIYHVSYDDIFQNL